MNDQTLSSTPLPWVQRSEPAKPDELSLALNCLCPVLWLQAKQLLPQNLQSKADPEDLVQDACLEAMSEFEKFRGETLGDLLAWIGGILRHVMANFLKAFRRQKRDSKRESSLEDILVAGVSEPRSREPAPEARMLYQEEIGAPLASAILVLKYLAPGPPARVFTLHHEEECSLAAIANLLGSSKSAVHRLWQEAIADLKYLVLVLSRQLA